MSKPALSDEAAKDPTMDGRADASGDFEKLPWEKLGAALYAAWGLWHLQVVSGLWRYGANFDDPAAGVRLQQGAWHILWFVIGGIAVAALYNWRNSRFGYWANLAMIGWTEVGLLYLFILPGLFPWFPTGWVGPTLFGLAVAASTIALRTRKVTP